MYPPADAPAPPSAGKPPPQVPDAPGLPHAGGPAAPQWAGFGGGGDSDDEGGGGEGRGPALAVAYGTVSPGRDPRAGGGGWGPEEVVFAVPVQRARDADGPAGR
jgi:hypothetical protein